MLLHVPAPIIIFTPHTLDKSPIALHSHYTEFINTGTSITAQHPQHNIYVRVKSVGETATVREMGNRYKTPVTVHVKTIKEGNIAERIELVLEEDSATSLSLLVTAKVLHTHQGNPLLKDGVHVVSHEHGEDSENTEWPGHWRDQSHLPADDDDEDTLL